MKSGIGTGIGFFVCLIIIIASCSACSWKEESGAEAGFLRLEHPVSVDEGTQLTVRVFDGHKLVEGAAVRFEGDEKTTDSDGTATFTVPPVTGSGKGLITVSKQDYSQGASAIYVMDTDAPPYPQWDCFLGSAVYHAAPAIVNDALYIATDGGVLYAVDKSSGAKSHEHDFGDVILSSPIADSGFIYICHNEKPGTDCAQSRGTVLCRLSGEDLSLIEEFPTSPAEPPALPLWMSSSPAVGTATVYFGSIDGWFYAVDKFDFSAPSDSFYTGSRVYGTPVVTGTGKVVVSSCDGTVYAFQAGEPFAPIWTNGELPKATRLCLPVKPAVKEEAEGGRVFFPSSYGALHVLDLESGAELWSYDIYDTYGSAPHSPICRDGKVYITTAPPPWVPCTEMKLLVIDDETDPEGAVVERFEYSLSAGSAGMISSPPVLVNDTLCTVAGGTARAFSIVEGPEWSMELDWIMENVGKVYAPPAVDAAGGTLYVGSANGHLFSFDLGSPSGLPSFDLDIETDEYPTGGIVLAPPFSHSDTHYSSVQLTDADTDKSSGMLYAHSEANEECAGYAARAHLWNTWTWEGSSNTDMVVYTTVRLEQTVTETKDSSSARLHVWLRVEDLDSGDTVSARVLKMTEAGNYLMPAGAWKSSEKQLHCPLPFRARVGHDYKIEVWGEAHSSAFQESYKDFDIWGEATSELECYVEDLRITMEKAPFIDVSVVNGSGIVHDTYDVWEDSVYDQTGERYGIGYFKIKVSAGYYDHTASYVKVRVPVSRILECDLGGMDTEQLEEHVVRFKLPPAENFELGGSTWFTLPYLVVDGEITGPQFALIPEIGRVGEGIVDEIIEHIPPCDPDSAEPYAPVPCIGDLYVPDPYVRTADCGVIAEADGVELYPQGCQILDLTYLMQGDLYEGNFQTQRALTAPRLGDPFYLYKEEDEVVVEGYVYNGGFSDTGRDSHAFNVVFDMVPRAKAWSVQEPIWATDY